MSVSLENPGVDVKPTHLQVYADKAVLSVSAEARGKDKLPEHTHDKIFPRVSLPIYLFYLQVKKSALAIKDFIFGSDTSSEAVIRTIMQAHEERDTLNVMRIQRVLAHFKSGIASAIRSNQDFFVAKVGSSTTENIVVAAAIKKYFIDIGYEAAIINEAPYFCDSPIFVKVKINYN